MRPETMTCKKPTRSHGRCANQCQRCKKKKEAKRQSAWTDVSKLAAAMAASVSVLQVSPLFLPVDDIQHNHCACRFFYPLYAILSVGKQNNDDDNNNNPREIQVVWSQNYATDILQYVATYLVCSKHISRHCNTRGPAKSGRSRCASMLTKKAMAVNVDRWP